MRHLLAATLVAVACPLFAADPLIIHEWGTFTSLQDEQGRTIGGLNIDEEYLPEFVHDLHPVSISTTSELPPVLFSKGLSACEPSVTMRLETPVVYVHLPPGQTSATFDLTAEFHGGFLSQFYPLAEASVNGRALRWQDVEREYIQDGKPKRYFSRELQVQGPQLNGQPTWDGWRAPTLDSSTISTLAWRNIRVGGSDAAPTTTSPVWLAPRAVDAANLNVGKEHERYLFYRGLAHLDAPLVVRRSAQNDALHIEPRADADDPSIVPALWLADLRADGTAAFRHEPITVHHIQSAEHPAYVDLPATFSSADYSAERLATLRQELHAALVADGLFADEATALLTTWEVSYFKAPGQRLFFLVPRAWTDRVLPLKSSAPATVTRVMMGRIEVVSPAQRQALARIASGPVSTTEWFKQFEKEHIGYIEGDKYIQRPHGQEVMNQLSSGERGVLAKLKVAMPADYQAYLSLGRFREALLWDAQRRTPDAELAKFLRTYVVEDVRYLPSWQKDLLAGKSSAVSKDPEALVR